jgi:YihY family inner membrane protein
VDLPPAIGRLLGHPRIVFARAVIDGYGAAAGGLLANGLAFAALFAALPILLLVLGITGFVARDDPAYQRELVAQLAIAFPPLRELLDDVLVAVSDGAGASSVVGVVGLVWAVSQFYATLDTAFARIFSSVPERDMAVRTLRGFLWVLLLVGLVVSAVVLASAASLLDAVLPSRLPIASTVARVLTSPPAILGLAVLVVAVAYRVLPPRAPSWRVVLFPAVVVGFAITLLTQAFGALSPILVRSAALVGSLAAAFIALAWLSFTFQFLLLGAAWVRVRWRGVPPAPGD